MGVQTFRIRQRRRGFGTKLLHAGRHQFAEQIQLQAIPGGSDFGTHFQRIAGDVRQVMAFIQHQQQIFRVRQHRFAFHCRHYQCMVCHHHFCFLNLTTRHKERALTIVMTVAVQTTGFVGAQSPPEIVINGDIRMIAQAVPLVAVKVAFQLCAALLFFLVVRREFIVKKREQILLRGFSTGQRCQISRTHIAAAAKRGGKAKIGNDFAQ